MTETVTITFGFNHREQNSLEKRANGSTKPDNFYVQLQPPSPGRANILMKNFSVTLQDCNTANEVPMSKSDIETIFGNRTFDGFQNQLIRIVNEQKMHAVVRNSRGAEIFTMRFSPSCSEGICCMWENTARLNRFIKSFRAA